MHKQQLLMASALFVAALVPAPGWAVPHSPLHAHVRPAAVKIAPVRVAPADEYFGRMKMSILGISNTIHDTTMRENFDPANASKYHTSLALTEDALQDWARKYPQDAWIPRRAYDLSHAFWKEHTPEGDAAAQRCRNILFSQFPHNHWAAIARGETAAKVAPVPVAPVANAAKQQ